jgi:hypothetical protein
LATDFALLSDMLEDLEAARVGQCLGDTLKLIGVHGTTALLRRQIYR